MCQINLLWTGSLKGFHPQLVSPITSTLEPLEALENN